MPGWVELLSCLPYWSVSLFAPEWLLDLSSGLRQLPFFLLLVDITLVRLFFFSVLLYFTHFSLPLLSLSQCLSISFRDFVALALLYTCDVYFTPLFLCQGWQLIFWLLVLSTRLVILTSSSSSPLSESAFFSFFSQAKRSQAVCPDLSVPVNALAWRLLCAAATSTSTRCPKASPGTWLNCESLSINFVNCIFILSVWVPGIIVPFLGYEWGKSGKETKGGTIKR